MDWLNNIKVVIFDMDGTLYQDDTFLGRYITHLLHDELSERELQNQIDDAYAILDGSHPVKLGYFYNRINHNVYAHENLVPTACYFWDGRELEFSREAEEDLFYIGDPWSIAQAIAQKHGISIEKGMYAFNKVRKEMLCHPYEIRRCHPLFDSIGSLAAERKIFMTNTPGPSGPEFVRHLKLENLFDTYIYDAKKPGGMKEAVDALLAEGYKADEILSVGDNPFNDLHPVKKAGGRTCLISQYAHAETVMWDHSVKTVEELAEFLGKLQAVHA